MTHNHDNQYILGRSLTESVRLNGQHFIWKLQAGYSLHPRIPISNNMRIADVGTGTGIWLLEIAEQLPNTVQMEGIDVSPDQFPPQYCVPEKVSFKVIDMLGETILPEMEDQYDVVHLRLWACIIQGNDPSQLIKNVKAMLKPNGYLQWEDITMDPNAVHVSAAGEILDAYQQFLASLDIDLDWTSNLPHLIENAGIRNIQYRNEAFSRVTEYLQSVNFPLGIEVVIQVMRQQKLEGAKLASLERLEEVMHIICQLKSTQHIIPFTSICLLAQNSE